MSVDGFGGEQLHAHSWEGPAGYAGKNVLLVGGGDSAYDIALILVKFRARQVAISIRTGYEGMKVIQHNKFCSNGADGADDDDGNGKCIPYVGISSFYPAIKSARGSTVTFADGRSMDDVDTIIWCTGCVNQFLVFHPRICSREH